ncbi:RNA-directed DNA polymerase, eukaryota, reverse transcriptase zinc-binding domain protein [Tanacetum coccineum]
MNNEATKDGVVPYATVAFGNNTSTQDENMGQCSYIAPLNKGNVSINTNDFSLSLSRHTSYANLVTGEPTRNVSPTTRKTVNFRTLITPAGNGPDFNSKDGLDAILENGPCFIRNNQLILKKWNPDVSLLKEDVGNVPVWVKLHGVHFTAFSEDGLSVIATILGTSLMLDSYTSDMYMQSWGRSSYVKAMIELQVDVELKDIIIVAMPKCVGEVFYMCTIRVEYEWKPPRCSSCKVFDHVLDECPKNIGSVVVKNVKTLRQATRGV